MGEKNDWPLAARLTVAILWSALCLLGCAFWSRIAAGRPPWFAPAFVAVLTAIALVSWLTIQREIAWVRLMQDGMIGTLWFACGLVDFISRPLGKRPSILMLAIAFGLMLMAVLRWRLRQLPSKADSSLRSE